MTEYPKRFIASYPAPFESDRRLQEHLDFRAPTGPVIEGEIVDDELPPDDAPPEVRFKAYMQRIQNDMRALEMIDVTPEKRCTLSVPYAPETTETTDVKDEEKRHS